MNDVRVNLAERDQRPAFFGHAELVEICRAVALDCGFGVVFRESQVECAAAVGSRIAAEARGKSVNEPRELAQMRGAKNVRCVLFRSPSRHPSMLTVGPALPHAGQELMLSCRIWRTSA